MCYTSNHRHRGRVRPCQWDGSFEPGRQSGANHSSLSSSNRLDSHSRAFIGRFTSEAAVRVPGPHHHRNTTAESRGYLSYTPTDRPPFKRLARVCTCISFGLLMLIAVSLLTSPFTQGVWTWDRFLHGGQDF